MFQVTGQLLGGLALFLFGMQLASSGLRKGALTHLRAYLALLTRNRFAGLLVGVVVTLVLGSSTAVSSMLVTIAQAGLMTLDQVVAVLLGSTVGTALTMQILAFNVADVALYFVVAGFAVQLLGRYRRTRHLGEALIGIGLLFFGIGLLTQALSPLSQTDLGRGVGKLLGNGFVGFAFGCVFTALAHGSAVALAGIAMPLVQGGVIPFEASIPIILGANLGTCFTSLAGSLVADYRGKRVAVAYLAIKVVGVLVFIPFVGLFAGVVQDVSSWLGVDGPRRLVANAHALFNIANVVIFLPFVGVFSALIARSVRARSLIEAARLPHISPQDLAEPTAALENSYREIKDVASLVGTMLNQMFEAIRTGDDKLVDRTVALDDKVDLYDEVLVEYLARLKGGDLTQEEREMRSKLLFALTDLENIGDVVSKETAALVRQKLERNLQFLPSDRARLEQFCSEVLASYRASEAFLAGDRSEADCVLARERTIEGTKRAICQAHLSELTHEGEATRTSAVFVDLLNAVRRVHYYASDIVTVLEMRAPV